MNMARPATAVDVMTVELPSLSSEEVQRLLRDVYGIEGVLRPLSGERDQNFRVDATTGATFVLKIANAAESTDTLDFQTTALDHIAQTAPELPVPRTVPTVDRRKIASFQSAQGVLPVRMLTHLAGEPALLWRATPLFRRKLGALVARLDQALKTFDHPAADGKLIWDLQHAGELAARVAAISDPESRALAQRVTARFNEKVAPALKQLRRQVIHNDVNHYNILRADEAGSISGIIDFGDMVRSPLINEVAIAVAHQLYRQNDPVAVACEIIEGYASVELIEKEEVDLLPDLVAMRLASREIIAAWRAEASGRPAGYRADISALGLDALKRWTEIGWDRAAEKLAAAASGPARSPRRAEGEADPEYESLMARRSASLGPLYKEFYQQPFFPLKGEGVWVTDHRGKRYLDAYNNVPHVGHCHPHVVEAVTRQLGTFNSNTRYPSDLIVAYAERIAATMPDPLTVCMFTCSGTEANELAWRIACANSAGSGALVTSAAFHGNSTVIGALDTSTIPAQQLESWVASVPAPEFPGVREDLPSPDPQQYAAQYREALDGLGGRGFAPAAFFFCPVFASDGLRSVPPGFLDPAVAEVRRAGALVIADEVQTALGRTGTHFWGFQHAGIKPDIVTMGKPMGNGLPLAVVVTSRELVEGFLRRGRYFNTFGGNQVVAAAGMAVLDVLEKEGLQQHALTVGAYLRAEIAAMMPRHAMIGDVRGTGLFVGVEIVTDRGSNAPDPLKARAIIEALLRRGVLVGITGAGRNLLKIRPPMVFSREHADLLVGALDGVLTELR
jgi:4-aminobutyrate aminotransferase-like enzyme/Ser/Thr protein kinase RdoA (MazF antagonist)